jgi:hypothetical protein
MARFEFPVNVKMPIESAKERAERRKHAGTYKRLLIFCALIPFRQLLSLIHWHICRRRHWPADRRSGPLPREEDVG